MFLLAKNKKSAKIQIRQNALKADRTRSLVKNSKVRNGNFKHANGKLMGIWGFCP